MSRDTPDPEPDGTRTTSRARWAPVVVVVAATAVLVYWFASARTWDPTVRPALGASEFFRAQADAMLHGRLHVDPADLPGECYLVDGRCYGYYGLTPSLLRIPVFPILAAADSGLTPLFLTAAIVVAHLAAIHLTAQLVALRPAARRHAPLVVTVAAIGLGFAGALVVTTRPFVYDEAVAWAVAFTLLTFDVAVLHLRRGTSPVWMVLPAVAAANSRPTAAPTMVVLGIGLAWLAWRSSGATRRVVIACVAVAVLPAATMALVFGAKFGAAVPDLVDHEQVPEAPVWQAVLEANSGVTISPVFVPSGLVAYTRPDSLTIEEGFPWVGFRIDHGADAVYPVAEGGVYATRLASLTDLMPVPVALTVVATAAVAVALRRRRADGAPSCEPLDAALVAVLGAAAAAAGVVTLTNVAITQRNVLDFFPLLTVGTAYGGSVAAARLERAPTRWRTGIGTLISLLLLWSTWAAFAIAWRFTPAV